MALFDRNAQSRIAALAISLDVEPAALLAVSEIESAGRPFMDDGRTPKFLFEAHKFWKHLGPGSQRDRAAREGLAREKWNRKVQYKSQGNDAGRMRTLSQARAIDAEAANKSCSWGLGQVMGEHAVSLGYPSATAMVEAMTGDVAAQVEVMARFIRRRPALLRALRSKDWAAFARGYNGPGYKENAYDTKMAAAYQRWARSLGAPAARAAVAEIAPVPAPIVEPTGTEIRALKAKMRDLGYVMLGEPDDQVGPRTIAAIAAFQTVNGLPLTNRFDEETRRLIDAGGKPMEVAPARAEATEAEIAAKVPEVAAARKTGIMGIVQATGAFFGAVYYVLKDFAAEAVDVIRPIKEVIDDVPSKVWVLAIAAMAGSMWWQARNAAKAGAEAYRKGERT